MKNHENLQKLRNLDFPSLLMTFKDSLRVLEKRIDKNFITLQSLRGQG